MDADVALSPNPFRFMVDPEAVMSCVAASEALKALRAKVVRKLDRSPVSAPFEVLAFDAAIEDGKSADAALNIVARTMGSARAAVERARATASI